MTCPHETLCKAGDACAGHCRKPMDQFYTATQRDRTNSPKVTYLVEKAEDTAIEAGYVVKELDRQPAQQGCYPGCFYYSDSCFRQDCKR